HLLAPAVAFFDDDGLSGGPSLADYWMRPAVAYSFDDDGPGGHSGGLELFGHVRRVTWRHQVVLGAVEQQERRRGARDIHDWRHLFVKLGFVVERSSDKRDEDLLFQFVAPGFLCEVRAAKETDHRLDAAGELGITAAAFEAVFLVGDPQQAAEMRAG